MKNIILILFTFLSLASYGQIYLLNAYIIGGTDTVGITVTDWERDSLFGNNPFVADTVILAGYADISSPKKWEIYYAAVGYNYCQFRNALIDLNVTWDTLSISDKQTMVRHYVYPSATIVDSLDLLYTQQQRDGYKIETMSKLGEAGVVVRRSKTVNSMKYFTYEVDDAEVLFTDEILSDAKLTDL